MFASPLFFLVCTLVALLLLVVLLLIALSVVQRTYHEMLQDLARFSALRHGQEERQARRSLWSRVLRRTSVPAREEGDISNQSPEGDNGGAEFESRLS